jgi:hypothetical protein
VADRTSNVLESCFRALKHGGRRRSGRKILWQDFEHLPAAAALAANLNHADYVPIVCGSLDRLPEAFAKLDARSRQNSPSPTVLSSSRTGGAETASLSTADRQTVGTKEMTSRIIAAAKSRLRKKEAARSNAESNRLLTPWGMSFSLSGPFSTTARDKLKLIPPRVPETEKR